MTQSDTDQLFARVQALEIALKSICAHLPANQASGALNFIQQLTSDIANASFQNPRDNAIKELTPGLLLQYQKILLSRQGDV